MKEVYEPLGDAVAKRRAVQELDFFVNDLLKLELFFPTFFSGKMLMGGCSPWFFKKSRKGRYKSKSVQSMGNNILLSVSFGADFQIFDNQLKIFAPKESFVSTFAF